ncbi:PREDICTED: uncharacterized protein LOC108377586, partial [Rhagoletis zephyria]|uniref:uncharacterized protein LOC108377586 n=1 Tax=Rhagoletis zephyria TaxID=28612 RepID=UPI0008114100
IFMDLIRLRIEAGDESLKKHFEEGPKNAKYTSPESQNEIIALCGEVVKDMIIADAKKASAYSILADETADISGKEQLSLILRQKPNEIDRAVVSCELEPNKCVGQGYDGCSAMTGKGGVQAHIRKKYKKALFFHCASHRLNLGFNDLNTVPEVRNTIGTIKDIIRFFRESVLRRKCAPNIPAFCETRWSQKHKSIAVFKENFVEIVNALLTLSTEGNAKTRSAAFQLHSAPTKPVFIICTSIIAKYSDILELVVNGLQSKSLDLLKCKDHLDRIPTVISSHRTAVDTVIDEILDEAKEIAKSIDIELDMPRLTQRQQHRSNQRASSPNDYWKISLLIPYLDSLISSLANRFASSNLPAFSLLTLHPYIVEK